MYMYMSHVVPSFCAVVVGSPTTQQRLCWLVTVNSTNVLLPQQEVLDLLEGVGVEARQQGQGLIKAVSDANRLAAEQEAQ